MRDERGNHVFEVLQARAACAECIEKLDDPSKCPHIQYVLNLARIRECLNWPAKEVCVVVHRLERPAWKSKEKQQVVKVGVHGSFFYFETRAHYIGL